MCIYIYIEREEEEGDGLLMTSLVFKVDFIFCGVSLQLLGHRKGGSE